MTLGGGDDTGEVEGICQELPEDFLEELQEGMEHLPEEVARKLLESMDKDAPWKVGSWTVLREGFTGLLTSAIKDCYEAAADVEA